MKYLFLAVATLVLFAGCTSPTNFPHVVFADVYTTIQETGEKAPLRVKTSVDVLVMDWDGFDMVPIALTGTDTIPLGSPYSYYYYDYPYMFEYYKDSTNYHLRDTVEVKVVYDDGEIKGSLPIPDTFKITSPDSSTGIISKNSSYTIAWNASQGADYYYVYFSLYYEYGYHDVWIDTSFPTKETSYTFPADYLFPENVDSISWSYGGFSVSACSGPMIWPGENIRNMEGTGKGYYTVETNDYRNHKSLMVEGSSYKEQESSKESTYEHIKKMIERMEKLSGETLPSLPER